MPDADDLWAALEAHPAFDRATVLRGRAYEAQGRVRRLQAMASGAAVVVGAVVDGTVSYAVSVTGTPVGRHLELSTRCTCPLAADCKHVVATVLALQRRDGRLTQWRAVLDQVLDDTEDAGRTTAVPEPAEVAVQLVVPQRTAAERRWPAGSLDLSSVSVCAVRRASTGRWVKTGVGWADLSRSGSGLPRPGSGPSSTTTLRPDDRDGLEALGRALSHQHGYLLLNNRPVGLAWSAPEVWRALQRLAELGVPLVCSDPSVAVVLAEDVARPAVDLSRRSDGLRLSPGVSLDGAWFGADDVGLVGEPAHGLVGWRPAAGSRFDGSRSATTSSATMTLARFGHPLADGVRRWVEGDPLAVDPDGAAELERDYLPRLRRTVVVGSRDSSVAVPGAPTVRLHGDVTWHEDGRVELSWRWSYRHAGEARQFPIGDRGRAGERDRAAETALLDALAFSPELAELLSVGTHGPGSLAETVVLRDVEAMRFAAEHLPWLAAQPSIELVSNAEPPDFREVTGVPQVRFDARGDAERKNRTDWLELDVVVAVTDEVLGPIALDLPRVLAALVSGETKILVHRGVYVDVDRPELDRLARLVHASRELTDQPPSGLRLTRQSHDLLAEIADLGPTSGQVAEWAAASRALRTLVESGQAPAPAPVPAGLAATLRPYQHDGFQWLHFLQQHRLGGVLADDMGLGKTVQMLAMIMADRETGDAVGRRPYLVLAPSSVVSTWASEASRFTPGLTVVPITQSTARRGWSLAADQPAARADVVVTTYTLFRLEADQYAGIRWAGLVLDEAQAVKNHRSQTHLALRRLDVDCRFAITGTPIENNLMELWSILSLTAPGLYPHADQFRTEVAQPVEQQADPTALAELRRRIRPVLLRRTKEVVAADLPTLQQQTVLVELSPRHRRIYDTHLQRERQRVLKLLDDLDDHRITVLASLTRLRQLSLDPALLDPAHEAVGSAKLDELVVRLTEIIGEGHRALVFSQFTSYLTRVRRRLVTEGIDHAYLDGATTKRSEVIAGFRDGTSPVFAISLKAGGVGLTLTEADYCFLLDPWWNPAVEAQAIGRAHRIGQERPVMAYRLVSAGTIEEKVIELASRKADLYSSVLDTDGQLSPALTAEDIAALLG